LIAILGSDRSNPRDVVEGGFIGEAALRVDAVRAVGLFHSVGGGLGGFNGDAGVVEVEAAFGDAGVVGQGVQGVVVARAGDGDSLSQTLGVGTCTLKGLEGAL
jgi:hypothetical protein